MKHIFLLYFLFIMTADIYAQSPDSTRHTFTAEVKLFDKFDRDAAPIPVLCITHAGDTVDLAAYIAREIQYPEFCIEMNISGTSYYQLKVDQHGKIDSIHMLKKLNGCETPVTEALNHVLYGLPKILYPPGGSMDMMLRIEAYPMKPLPAEPIIIEPIYKGKNNHPHPPRKKKNKRSR